MSKIEDLQISKMSYTDKDFAALYPDLLDYANKLESEWTPALSNESDPGVVLLKEAAFVADHLNYNSDKNILEAFLPSATQDKSTRNLVEMNGYTPGYFESASGDVTVSYYSDSDDDSFNGFTIAPFELVLTNENEDVSYTLIEEISINKDKTTTVQFMEGIIQTLSVNGSNIILLENIDDENKIYLPDLNVAQNGIFISNADTDLYDEWVRTDYILTLPIGTKCFKVDYDSNKRSVFIQFPSDIVNLIGSGLRVRYIISSGSAGNVKAGVLNKIANKTDITVREGISYSSKPVEDFTVSNFGSILNGRDPENIDQMYKSFKQVVGTFDTLVTCKDYTNAVNRLKDDNNNKFVSNAVVTDRRDEYNGAINIITFDQYGQYFLNAGEKLPSALTDIPVSGHASTAFDLTISAFLQYNPAAYDLKRPETALNTSFTPYDTFKGVNGLGHALEKNYKCISHDIKDFALGDIHSFKNYAKLDMVIMPYHKVSEQIRDEIIANIKKALSDNFNASGVEFGEELDYNTVYNVILNCDERIKNIKLSDIEYTTKAVISTGTSYIEKELTDDDNAILIDLLAKNILAGRIALYLFDDSFCYAYGLSDITSYNGVATITSNANITIPVTDSYIVLQNEFILIAEPTYTSDTIWPTFSGYQFNFSTTIHANQNYLLQQGETLKMWVVNLGVSTEKTYEAGDIISPNFELTTVSGQERSLGAGQMIYHKSKYVTILNTSYIPAYWITKHENNDLFGDDTTVILNSGEYFIYSNKDKTSIVILGQGTKLTRASTLSYPNYNKTDWKVNLISFKSIADNGINADIPWVICNFSGKVDGSSESSEEIDNIFTITEMTLTTLGEGAQIKTSNQLILLSNTWVDKTNTDGISYRLSSNDDWIDLVDSEYWLRSRLDISAGKNNGQHLVGGLTIILKDSNGDQIGNTISSSSWFLPSVALDIYGGDDISIKSLFETLSISDELSVKSYQYISDGALCDNVQILFNEESNGSYVGSGTLEPDKQVVLKYGFETGECVIPIYFNFKELVGGQVDISCLVNSSSGTVQELNDTTLTQINYTGVYLLTCTGRSTQDDNFDVELTFENTGSDNVDFEVEYPVVINGLNIKMKASEVGITSDNIIDRMKDLVELSNRPTTKIYYIYKPEQSIEIQNEDITDPDFFWDVNNVANKITIPQINLVQDPAVSNSINIEIVKSMRDY